MVRAVTSREPEWTPDEVSALLASRIIEKDLGPHGHPISEATSPDANPARRDAKYKYVPRENPAVDYAAKALAEHTEAYRKKHFGDKSLPAGYHFAVDRVDLQ